MLRPLICPLLVGLCCLARAAEPAAAPVAGSAPAPGPAALIRVGGSDLLQTAVGEPLTRFVRQTHLNVKVDMLGSVPALSGLKEGKIQLAIIASPVGQPPAPPEFKTIPFGFQVDYVIVNQANPLTTLTLRQLAGIYGSVQQSTTHWGDVQLTGDWISKPILAYSTSADDGVVVELFKNLILGRQVLNPAVRATNTSAEMVKAVTDNDIAIGLCGYDPGPPNKVLLISSEKSASSVSAAIAGGASRGPARPTPENVFSGAYPLRLPFYLVYKPADLPRILPLLRALLGQEYADHLSDEHFVPVPDTERSSALLRL